MHPGIVEAKHGRGMVVPPLTPFAKDNGLLFGGASLYLQQPAADFLHGGFFSANWDLPELEAHQDELAQNKLVKMAFLNARLAPGGYG